MRWHSLISKKLPHNSNKIKQTAYPFASRTGKQAVIYYHRQWSIQKSKKNIVVADQIFRLFLTRLNGSGFQLLCCLGDKAYLQLSYIVGNTNKFYLTPFLLMAANCPLPACASSLAGVFFVLTCQRK